MFKLLDDDLIGKLLCGSVFIRLDQSRLVYGRLELSGVPPAALLAIHRGQEHVLIGGEAMKQFQSTREKKEGKLHAIGFLSEKLEQLILRILLVFKKRIDKVEYHNHQGLVWPRCHIVAEHIRWNLSFIGGRDGSGGLNRACEFMEILDLLGPPVFFNLKVFWRQAFDRVSSGVGHHHVDYHFLHGRLESADRRLPSIGCCRGGCRIWRWRSEVRRVGK